MALLAFHFSSLTSAAKHAFLWISEPRAFSESQPHPSLTAPGKGAQEIINFTASCKITCFSGPLKAGAGNIVWMLVTAEIFHLLLLFLQMEGKTALSDCHEQRYASNCFLDLASDPEKNNCLRLTQTRNFTELLVKWNSSYWVKMPHATLPLTRSELFYLGGVGFNLVYRRRELYSTAAHLACVGAGMGTQHSCDLREPATGWMVTTCPGLWGKRDRTLSSWTRPICWAVNHVKQRAPSWCTGMCQSDWDPGRIHLPEHWCRVEMSPSE